MSLDHWISDFLAKRGLQHPDGRPLFSYKTSADEYKQLRQLLRSVHASKHAHTLLPQAWLLFAAEWWKREYQGGAWRWAPLCEAAGQLKLSHTHTTQLVTMGHKQWRLQTDIKSEGKRFIGQVAVNGGLPMRLVESAQGGLSGLLRMVTEQALRYQLAPDQIRQAIEAQATLLPSSYQQEPVYELLDSLIQEVLHIQKTYELQGIADPIAKLQELCPNWDKRFPIALDNQAAASLIKGLVRGVVNISPQSTQLPFQIQRGLRFDSDNTNPVYELSFTMQAQATPKQVAETLGIDAEQLPPHFQLLLRIEDQDYLVGEALLRDDKYQLLARPFPPLQTLYPAVQLIISRWGATLHIATLPGGEALSYDEPVILEHDYPFARFVTQGDALIKGISALAITPSKTIVFSEDGEVNELSSGLSDKQILFELPEGKTRFVYSGQSFIVTVSANASVQSEAYWQGHTLEITSTPGLLFKGLPRLRISQEQSGYGYAPSHELFIRTQSGEIPFGAAAPQGLCRLTWRKDGQRLMSTRAVILAENASVAYAPGLNTSEGKITLINWPNVQICSETSGVEIISKHDGTSLNIDVNCTTVSPPSSISLSVNWPAGEQKIILPFPSYGVRLLGNQGQLRSGQTLTVEELMGCRALLLSAQGAMNWRVRLSSIGPDDQSKLSQELSYTGISEIRLFELIPAIRQMLSCYPTLDHTVLIELIHSHQTHAHLNIGSYSTRLLFNSQNQTISVNTGSRDLIIEQEQAEGLLQALPLIAPESDPNSLSLHLSEQVFTGSWLANLPEDILGPWLIYAVDNSQFYSRPAVISPPPISPSNKLSPLRQALCEAHPEIRMDMLISALQSMTDDTEHQDWQTLEALLDKLQHLPLASLDICQALIREPAALVTATLLLDNFSSKMAERLPMELPFEWLLIAPQHWQRALCKRRKQFPTIDKSLLGIVSTDIHNKSQYLTRWQPALSFIFKQGFHSYFEKSSVDVSFFLANPSMLANIRLDQLFEGEHSAMQQMFRRNSHNNQQWPVAVNTSVVEFLQIPDGITLLNQSKLPYNDFKLNVVILPFLIAFDTYAGKGLQWQAEPAHLFSLRSARQFDTVWFDDAYEAGLIMAQANSMKK